MRFLLFWIAFLLMTVPAFFTPTNLFGQHEGFPGEEKTRVDPAAEVIEHVVMYNIEADLAISETRKLIKKMAIHPRVTMHRYSPPDSDRQIVFIKGSSKDVNTVKSVLSVIDGRSGRSLYITRFPLLKASAEKMKERLLDMAGIADIDVTEDQFIVYPSRGRGSLFFIGRQAVGDELQEIRKEFDKERHVSAREALLGYLEDFHNSLISSLGKVLVYLFLALILISVHYTLTVLPGVGRVYERFFTAIWSKLIADFKGRDFALAIIRAAAEVAAKAAEGKESETRRRMEPGKLPSPEDIKLIAREKALVYLEYRGIDTRDKRVGKLLDTFIDAAMCRKDK